MWGMKRKNCNSFCGYTLQMAAMWVCFHDLAQRLFSIKNNVAWLVQLKPNFPGCFEILLYFSFCGFLNARVAHYSPTRCYFSSPKRAGMLCFTRHKCEHCSQEKGSLLSQWSQWHWKQLCLYIGLSQWEQQQDGQLSKCKKEEIISNNNKYCNYTIVIRKNNCRCYKTLIYLWQIHFTNNNKKKT